MNRLSYDLHEASKSVLKKHLLSAFRNKEENNVKELLTELGIFIPFEVYSWIIDFHEPSLHILDFIFEKQLHSDKFITKIKNCFYEKDVSVTEFKEIIKPLLPEVNDNDMYFLQKLLSNDDEFNLNKFPLSNIWTRYKNIYNCLNELVCDTIYFAQPNILQKIICLIHKHGIPFAFSPNKCGKQKAVYEWLMDNVGRNAGTVGWQCGPDSAKWPSTDVNDYKQVYNMLRFL